MLCAPSMEAVLQWRREQEWRLARDRAALGLPEPEMLGDQAMLKFVRHYERLTLHALKTLPQKADVTIWWNDKHVIDKSEIAK